MSRFQGKTVLVTGGTSGIGLATVDRLIREGARVAVTGSNPQRLADAAARYPGLVTIEADSGAPDTGRVVADRIRAEFGQLDAAFFNAGFGRFVPVEHVTPEEFDAQYHVNVRGPLLQAGALSDVLKDGAKIVFNTSIGQHLGMAGGSLYNSTKGALRTMVRVLAREFAPRQINVNAVSPGPIGTDFFNRTNLPKDQAQAFAEQIQKQVPLRRFGTPEEVAAVALFLLSDDASYVTGSEYTVDGGMSEL